MLTYQNTIVKVKISQYLRNILALNNYEENYYND